MALIVNDVKMCDRAVALELVGEGASRAQVGHKEGKPIDRDVRK